MRIAVFDVENLFDRATAFDVEGDTATQVLGAEEPARRHSTETPVRGNLVSAAR